MKSAHDPEYLRHRYEEPQLNVFQSCAGVLGFMLLVVLLCIMVYLLRPLR